MPASLWQLPLTLVVASKQVLQYRRPPRPVVIWQRGVELVKQLAALDPIIYQLRGSVKEPNFPNLSCID